MLGLAILVTMVSMMSAYSMAKKKGANQKFWVLMALLFGPLILPFILFSSSTEVDEKGSREM